MKNVFYILIVAATIILASCGSNNKKVSEELNGAHKVVVKEVLQANAYTYLNVTENKADQWIAVSKMNAQVGDVYYFDEFMEMLNFESKDLGRTFESVYFIQQLRTELVASSNNPMASMPMEHAPMETHEGKPDISKNEINIEPAKDGITIEELFSNLEKYSGKKVIIKGKIAKANFEIMNKNWFHIQDGTSANGKFDLTITSLENEVKLNDVLTFEGTIALNKDFGYGYSYEVLMEDGVIKR